MEIPPPPGFNHPGKKEYARTDFGPAPLGYIPGLGRGAKGFTTTAEYVTASDMVTKVGEDEEEDILLNFFNTKEDEEADEIYGEVEKRLDGRRKRRRDQKEEEELQNYRRKKPKITADFSSHKNELKKLTETDWLSIPEAVDRSHQRQAFVKYTPVPDTILMDQVRRNMDVGISQQIGTSKAKETIIKSKMTRITDNIDGQTNIDPESYLTSLSSQLVMKDSDITDLKRAREMMAMLTKTNPSSASGWIARARVEEIAGKLKQSRTFILEGCERAPKNQSVWLEASRLHDRQMGRHILAKAVEHLPENEAIWIAAIDVEDGNSKKQRVICRKALELIPKSIDLWKILIGLSPNNEQAKLLLSKAVEIIPHHIPFWIGLSKLEDYNNARKVLNMGRKKNPHEPQIWITAAQLEERMGKPERVGMIISKAIKDLQSKGVSLKRRDWIESFGHHCEEKGFPITGQQIIQASLKFENLDTQDYLGVWMKEAEVAEKSGHNNTSRWIWNIICQSFPSSEIVWTRRVGFEKRIGDQKNFELSMESSIKNCPNCDLFWLMWAKYWIDQGGPGNLGKAMSVLKDGLKLHQDNEDFWLGMVKIEWKLTKSVDKCRSYFQDALKYGHSGRVWMKFACFERNVGFFQNPKEKRHNEREKETFTLGLKQYPNFPRLWMMKCQFMETESENQNNNNNNNNRDGLYSKIYETYREGIKYCSWSIELWCCAICSAIKFGKISVARGLIAQSLLKHPREENIWCLRVNMEWAYGTISAARSLVEQGLKELPQSGRLWGLSIELEDRQKWMRRVKEMQERLESENWFVEVSIGKRLWREGNLVAARQRFLKGVKLEPDWGDGWCYLYKFEASINNQAGGNIGKLKNIENLCFQKKPKYGEIWCTVIKESWGLEDMSILDVLKKGASSIVISSTSIGHKFSSYVYKGVDEDENDDR